MYCPYLRKCNLSPSFLCVGAPGFVLAIWSVSNSAVRETTAGVKEIKGCGSGLVLQYPRGSQLYQEEVVQML